MATFLWIIASEIRVLTNWEIHTWADSEADGSTGKGWRGVWVEGFSTERRIQCQKQSKRRVLITKASTEQFCLVQLVWFHRPHLFQASHRTPPRNEDLQNQTRCDSLLELCMQALRNSRGSLTPSTIPEVLLQPDPQKILNVPLHTLRNYTKLSGKRLKSLYFFTTSWYETSEKAPGCFLLPGSWNVQLLEVFK